MFILILIVTLYSIISNFLLPILDYFVTFLLNLMMIGSLVILKGRNEMKGGLGVSMEMVEMSKVFSGLCVGGVNVGFRGVMWVLLSKTTFIQILNYLDEI